MTVVPGSGAAQAGLQQGDVITEVDGAQLREESTFAQAINSHKPGDKLNLTVSRNNKSYHVTVTLGQAE